ncbi:MAG: cupredoxin domain-containing protein [Nitrospiraceae bacterium]
MISLRQSVRQLIAGAWLVWMVAGAGPWLWAAPTVAPSDTTAEEQVLVTIKARSFEPGRVILHAGRKTKLVFHNQDAELHAFVPVGLFTGLSVNVSGNGAPDFGPDGFTRVIIPSDGRAEFRFVPEKPGVYPFFCDMPGHEMRATIVVE